MNDVIAMLRNIVEHNKPFDCVYVVGDRVFIFRDKRPRWSEAVFANNLHFELPFTVKGKGTEALLNLMKLLNIHVNEEYSCLSNHGEIEDFIAEQQARSNPIRSRLEQLQDERVALLAKLSACNSEIANVEKALAGELVQYNKLPAYLLDVSVRCQEAFKVNDIEFIGQLTKLTLKEVKELKGVGVKTFTEIKNAVERAGLSFAV